MSDADDSHTPGTDQDEIDEDATLVGSEPDEEAVEEPTTDQEQAARETKWIAKKWLSVGLVSIGATLLLIVGLLLATGLAELPSPIAEVPLAEWWVFLGLAAVLVAVFTWTQWRT